MKFLVLALTLTVALSTLLGQVSTAALGTGTWTNATTMAASVCTYPISIAFTVVIDSADKLDMTFLMSATTGVVASGDLGIQCLTLATTAGGVFVSGVTCSTVAFTSNYIRTGVTALTVT